MTGNNNAELNERILSLKGKRKAVILVHNYQLGEVQDIADFVGDSLDLSQRAAATDADVIVFCGVHFMAETASILCPDKIVLLERKEEIIGASVVCYVNSSAEVKAESDICCTSANAIKVIESLDANEILFVPDQYLGNYASTKTNKKMILWPGYCPTHVRILPQGITRLKLEYPKAEVIVHPECKSEVTILADEVLSTSGMLKFAQKTEAKEIIVGTEIGIIYRLKKENPGKKFIPASEQAVCPNMKLVTLEKILWSLEEMSPEVKVPEEIRLKAKLAVDKMLEIGRGD